MSFLLNHAKRYKGSASGKEKTWICASGVGQNGGNPEWGGLKKIFLSAGKIGGTGGEREGYGFAQERGKRRDFR